MALGANPLDVFKLIVGRGAALTTAGVVAGIMLAFVTTRFMSKLLFGISATDPIIFTTVAFALASVALLATYLPARRAIRIDPVIALRYE